MSGGVDSSVAAVLLKEMGYEVLGLTMRLWDTPELEECNMTQAEVDAKKICDAIGIKHYVADFRAEFRQSVIEYFVEEYQRGRTPNPCIVCNKFLKFDEMQRYAKSLGADYIATGHYAKIEKNEETGRFLLKKADSDKKDQTYALYSLSQEQLSKTLMPLGTLESKEKTREIAERLNLISANKKDSMEICFIPDGDYAGFIKKYAGIEPREGDFVDSDGNVLGRHKGIIHYTVGQRKGLGVTFGKPMFVTGIDAEKNQVILGESGKEFSSALIADKLNFISIETPLESIRVRAKIRYSAKEEPAIVRVLDDGTAKVEFDKPQRAVTPGQAVVFYEIDGDGVIGGGIIRNSID